MGRALHSTAPSALCLASRASFRTWPCRLLTTATPLPHCAHPHPRQPRPPGPWLTEFTDLRESLNRSHEWGTEDLRALTLDLMGRIEATGRTHPVPALSARALARMEAEAALQRAIEEQQREEQGLQALGGGSGGGTEQEAAAAAPAAEDAAPAKQREEAVVAAV